MTAHDDAMPLDITDADAYDMDGDYEGTSVMPGAIEAHKAYMDMESRPRHGRTCSSDPEIGCECGLADWLGDNGFRTLQEAWDADVARAAQVMSDDIDRHLIWPLP